MAYPTGSGSERLMRGAINVQDNDATSFKFDGTSPTKGVEDQVVPANHIITILSISIHDNNTTGKTFTIYLNDGSSVITLLDNVSCQNRETYIFNDKIVLQGGDSLIIDGDTSCSYDVWYSYISQNWVD